MWILQNNSASWLTLNVSTGDSSSPQVPDCQIKGVDMIFVMDESRSIGSNNYETMKQLAIDITDSFVIGPDRTQVGWINFSDRARNVFNLNAYQDKSSLHDAIHDVNYNGFRGTNIGTAVCALVDYGFIESAGYRESFDVPSVAILLTDGKSNTGSKTIPDAATQVRASRNVNVFVIGVGDDVDDAQIKQVARAGITDDKIIDRNIFHISGFNDFELVRIQRTIRARICFETMFHGHEETIEMLNAAGKSIPEGAIVRLNFVCPSEGLTVNACGKMGKTIFYISTHISNPSNDAYDYKLTIPAMKCRNTFVGCSTNRRRRQVSEMIFMNIEGAAEENVYDMNVSTGDSSTPQVNLLCESTEGSDGQSVVVSCISDRALTEILCSVNDATFETCTLPWEVTLTPPITEYHLQINVTDTLNLTETTTIYYQVGPLVLECSLDADLIMCVSSYQVELNKTLCSFNGNTAVPCTLPYDIHHDVKGLPVGIYFFTVAATGVFESIAQSIVEYYVVEDRVGDDMVMTVALDIRPYELGVTESKTVSLCYQVHGEPGKAYNLLSDECLSVNAHLGQPDINIDANIIDIITIRTTGSNGTCYDIVVMRPNCAVYVNNQMIPLNNFFEEEHVFVFNKKKFARKPTVVKVKVPNCGQHIVDHMLITCTDYHIQHSTTATEVLEFKTVRGMSPTQPVQGLIGQFWGRFMIGQPQTPTIVTPPKRERYDMTVFQTTLLQRFDGFVHGSWESSRKYCLYAGDKQGNTVIQGNYTNYEVDEILSPQFVYSTFNETKVRCPLPYLPHNACYNKYTTDNNRKDA